MRNIFLYMTVAILASCASSTKQEIVWEDGRKIEINASQMKWSKGLDGKVTELVSSKTGKTFVVAVIKNKKPYLLLVTGSGKIRWEKKLDMPVEKIALAENTKWIIVSLVGGKVKSFNFKGEQEWEKDQSCYPRILDSRSWLVCVSFIEEKDPKTLYVFSRNGETLQSHSFNKPIVDYAISSDEQNLLVGIEGGVVWYYRASHLEKAGARAFRKSTVNGEIMSLAVSEGLDPKAGVLFIPTKDVNYRGQRFALFDGSRKHEFLLKRHADGFDMKSDGSSVIFFGNGPQGQSISYYSKNRAIDVDPNDYEERWDLHRSHFADFSPNARQLGDLVIFGLERKSEKPSPTLLTLDNRGQIVGGLSIDTSYGAYIYDVTRASQKALSFVVATDDGKLQSFELPVSKTQ